MVIIVTGVSGSGKTTVGRALADTLSWRFIDADDLHPPANVEKMARNEPLTDADREPWLAAVRATITASIAADEPLILACSALKRDYRDTLTAGLRDVRFVYLKATRAELDRASRQASRPLRRSGAPRQSARDARGTTRRRRDRGRRHAATGDTRHADPRDAGCVTVQRSILVQRSAFLRSSSSFFVLRS